MPPTLAAALAVLQTHLPRVGKAETGEVKGTSKDGRPYSYTYQYADLPAISEELLPMLGELGLSFSSKPTLNAEGKFVLAYILRHVSGESDSGEYPLGGGTPQQLGGLITYARRYSLQAITGLAPRDGSDNDARAAEDAARAQRNHAPEVRADGSATEAEQSRMIRGPEPGTWNSASTDENDPWYDQRPADVLPEELPGSSLPGQRQDIYIAMSKRDITTPDARREAIERLTGRQVNAAKDMSFNEAAMVHAAVKGWDGRTEQLLGPLAAERSKADA